MLVLSVDLYKAWRLVYIIRGFIQTQNIPDFRKVNMEKPLHVYIHIHTYKYKYCCSRQENHFLQAVFFAYIYV